MNPSGIDLREDAAETQALKPKIHALTSLRFLAAFGILALHYRDMLGRLPDWFMRTLIAGEYGVTFFFVLSGFILTYNYFGWFRGSFGEARAWKFFRLRFARIYPLYLVGLLLDAPWHLIERFRVGQLANSGAEFWASWLLNLCGLQAWVPATPYAMVFNTPSWSLSAEFFFYATFPFVMRGIVKYLRSPRALIAACLAAIVGSTMLYVGVIYWLGYVLKIQPLTNYMVIYYNPVLRYAEFFSGCLAGCYFVVTSRANRYPLSFMFSSARRRSATVTLCLVLSAYRATQIPYSGPSESLWLLDNAIRFSWFIGPFAIAIVAIAKGTTIFTRILETPLLVALGEASFALYITHWSVLSFLKLMWPSSTTTIHLCAFLISLAGSILLYRYVEQPARRWLTKRRGTALAGQVADLSRASA
ncbi:MAG: acyltransferase [Paraburkholderia sp.]|jgi:peptidoglycan/LPS O-acetylase OafA/YrhL|uniref:acyltransferase family protein n=2 Tax=Burkholderiales TaxID=80840 RepID=UPI0010F6CFEE|nr:acyltransferase [Burkholderia sp. 4M9327F10]